jgi:hypothetical protein
MHTPRFGGRFPIKSIPDIDYRDRLGQVVTPSPNEPKRNRLRLVQKRGRWKHTIRIKLKQSLYTTENCTPPIITRLMRQSKSEAPVLQHHLPDNQTPSSC